MIKGFFFICICTCSKANTIDIDIDLYLIGLVWFDRFAQRHSARDDVVNNITWAADPIVLTPAH
jgi:hypothetical protein